MNPKHQLNRKNSIQNLKSQKNVEQKTNYTPYLNEKNQV